MNGELLDGFDDQIGAAHEVVTALAHAIERSDRAAAGMLAELVRDALDRIERAAIPIVMDYSHDPARQRFVGAALHALHERAQPLLVSPMVGTCDRPLVRRFVVRVGRDPLSRYRSPAGIVDAAGALIADVAIDEADLSLAQLTGATLHEVSAQRASLDLATAVESRFVHVDLSASSMRAVNLEACLAEDSNFTRARMQHTRWDGGTVVRCTFAGAVLTNLCAEGAVFIGCDFRTADLTVASSADQATLAGAQFIRCDLRWSNWSNRSLAGVSFRGCKLHGVHGRPSVDGVTIEDADLSALGDRSYIARAPEVLAMWTALVPTTW